MSKSNARFPLTRSFMIDEESWNGAKERAESEGVSMSQVIRELVTGYAQQEYNLPTRKVVLIFPDRR